MLLKKKFSMYVGILTQLNPFFPNVPFLYPMKTFGNGFLMFSGGRERLHWKQMGWFLAKKYQTVTDGKTVFF